MAKTEKHRYFLFIVYPESAPDDWQSQLKQTRCPFAISPLHAPDDENAKQHYHLMFYSPGPITLENAYRIIPESVPANGHIEWAKSPNGSQRYLIHLDDPEKEQFKEGVKAITVLNGFPLDLSREFSAAERRAQKLQVQEFIRDHEIFEYSDLLDALAEYDYDLWDFATNHTILFNTYITSRRNKAISENWEEE